MERDRLKWNTKYSVLQEPGKPASIVLDYYQQAPPGPALDLACGLGRHSLFLANQGIEVDAVDISDRALKHLEHPRVQTFCQDLDSWTALPDRYTLVVDLYFLDRRLFPQIISCLQSGGLLIMETALLASNHIGNPKYKLKPGELLAVFGHWEILYHSEAGDIGSLVARKP